MLRQSFYATKTAIVCCLFFLLLANAGCDLGTYDKRFRSRNTTEPAEAKAADDKAAQGEAAGDSN